MIGFFDSGLGGLSVLRAFLALAPEADIVYFGDTAHAPYGTRTPRELELLAKYGIEFLKARGATHIVAACNSVSPSVLAIDAGIVPTIEMSLPTARALAARHDERFLLLATPATIASGLYERATGGTLMLHSLPVPPLAGAIERGASADKLRPIIRDALALRANDAYDTLILGCTHYPLVRALIESEARRLFGEVTLFDPADAVAKEAAARFGRSGNGKRAFYLSRASAPFVQTVETLFPGRDYTLDIVETGAIV